MPKADIIHSGAEATLSRLARGKELIKGIAARVQTYNAATRGCSCLSACAASVQYLRRAKMQVNRALSGRHLQKARTPHGSSVSSACGEPFFDRTQAIYLVVVDSLKDFNHRKRQQRV